MDERDGDESTDEEYTYRITLHSECDKVQPLTEIIIGEKTVKCLIDSGAGVNVIDSFSFNQLTFYLPQRRFMDIGLPSRNQ